MTTPLPNSTLIELRAAVAEYVMGWKLFNYETGKPAKTESDFKDASNNDGWTWNGTDEAYKWQPDCDEAQAFTVLKKCMERRGTIGVSRFDAENFMCGKLLLDPVDAPFGKGPSLELAIVIFALRFHAPDHPVLKKL